MFLLPNCFSFSFNANLALMIPSALLFPLPLVAVASGLSLASASIGICDSTQLTKEESRILGGGVQFRFLVFFSQWFCSDLEAFLS